MICIVIRGPALPDAKSQIEKAIPLADLIELRLDLFDSLEGIKSLRDTFKVPMIFTLRPKNQGGEYKYDEMRRLEDIRSLAKLKPEYFDLEYNTSIDLTDVQVIRSIHNFKETPKDLSKLISDKPATYYKIATMANSTSDALRMLLFVRSNKSKIIGLCMGEAGQIVRILAPLYGAPWTYATLDEGQETAPGQLTAKRLIETYNYHSPITDVYGLIGDPIHTSISDETHNKYMKENHLKSIYVKMAVKIEELPEFVPLAKEFKIKGLSVTMPLKEHIIPYLDQIDQEAKEIGAVNTIVTNGDQWIGYNTDGVGALNAIENHVKVSGKKIALIGAGGAAKGIAFEAIKRGGDVHIFNRTADKAIQLAEKFKCSGHPISDLSKLRYDILINSTPQPFPFDPKDLIPGSIVMDIKTKPRETELLIKAKKLNCICIYGYEMFIEQANEQFSLWGFGSNRFNTLLQFL